MNYVLKQQLLSMKPSYKIVDSSQNELYKVKGSFVGRENFELRDHSDQLVAKCQTDLNVMSMLGSVLRYNFKHYNILVNDQEVFSVARSLNIFTQTYNVKSEKNDFTCGYGTTGSFQITSDGHVVCDIQKKNLTVGGAEYHIEIDDTQDQKAFLLMAIAIDRIFYTKR